MAVSKKAPAPRVLWKGAISFGLVHIPVALYSATTSQAIDFDWLDKRTMDPVGYKRINKKTGKEIARENIVKGIEYEDGEYVVLSDKEIADAYPKTTQTIEIESFVPANAIPFVYLERPYYVAPINRGAKVYALLRETLQRTGRIGMARVRLYLERNDIQLDWERGRHNLIWRLVDRGEHRHDVRFGGQAVADGIDRGRHAWLRSLQQPDGGLQIHLDRRERLSQIVRELRRFVGGRLPYDLKAVTYRRCDAASA